MTEETTLIMWFDNLAIAFRVREDDQFATVMLPNGEILTEVPDFLIRELESRVSKNLKSPWRVLRSPVPASRDETRVHKITMPGLEF